MENQGWLIFAAKQLEFAINQVVRNWKMVDRNMPAFSCLSFSRSNCPHVGRHSHHSQRSTGVIWGIGLRLDSKVNL